MATLRSTQRRPLSCSECTRRKLRCSKVLPCTSCRDRGLEASCSRETVRVSKKGRNNVERVVSTAKGDVPKSRGISNHELSSPLLPGASDDQLDDTRASQASLLTSNIFGNDDVLALQGTQGLSKPSSKEYVAHQHPSEGLAEDAAVTLENLALGRQRILNMEDSQKATTSSFMASSLRPCMTTGALSYSFDTLITFEQVKLLLKYYQDHLAWTHNLLHMTTFIRECETAFHQGAESKAWISLYYAVLCHFAYHASPDIVASTGLLPQRPGVEDLYTKCIGALHDADFMAVHAISAVQAVCIVIQVAHNLGHSDYAYVLLSCVTRIAQSLDLNRLGQDIPISNGNFTQSMQEVSKRRTFLVNREIKKRIWWFLIKQDWMQIPYGNLFIINAMHFNTPQPYNCHDDLDLMIENGEIVEQDPSVYTQSSWAGIHNRLAILVYKTHDKMCRLGHPGADPNGVQKLYAEVLNANVQLKQIWNDRPDFLRSEVPLRPDWPRDIIHIRRSFTISFARLHFTIHRHFQLRSFRDEAYTFTKICCLSAARNSLRTFIEWPEDEISVIYKRMWTNNNNIVAAAVALLFGVLFSSEDASGIFEKIEIRQILLDVLPSLRNVGTYSTIARRGVELITVIMDYDKAISEGARNKLDIEAVIGHVKRSGISAAVGPGLSPQNANQLEFSAMEGWEEILETFAHESNYPEVFDMGYNAAYS